jgi:cation transport ATPase
MAAAAGGTQFEVSGFQAIPGVGVSGSVSIPSGDKVDVVVGNRKSLLVGGTTLSAALDKVRANTCY